MTRETTKATKTTSTTATLNNTKSTKNKTHYKKEVFFLRRLDGHFRAGVREHLGIDADNNGALLRTTI